VFRDPPPTNKPAGIKPGRPSSPSSQSLRWASRSLLLPWTWTVSISLPASGGLLTRAVRRARHQHYRTSTRMPFTYTLPKQSGATTRGRPTRVALHTIDATKPHLSHATWRLWEGRGGVHYQESYGAGDERPKNPSYTTALNWGLPHAAAR